MTAEDKAKELVRKYWDLGMIDIPKAQKCELIAVDLILNQYNTGMFDFKILSDEEVEYWQEVKQEIEKL